MTDTDQLTHQDDEAACSTLEAAVDKALAAAGSERDALISAELVALRRLRLCGGVLEAQQIAAAARALAMPLGAPGGVIAEGRVSALLGLCQPDPFGAPARWLRADNTAAWMPIITAPTWRSVVSGQWSVVSGPQPAVEVRGDALLDTLDRALKLAGTSLPDVTADDMRLLLTSGELAGLPLPDEPEGADGLATTPDVLAAFCAALVPDDPADADGWAALGAMLYGPRGPHPWLRTYLRRRVGGAPVTYHHPMFAGLLDATWGLPLYTEQATLLHLLLDQEDLLPAALLPMEEWIDQAERRATPYAVAFAVGQLLHTALRLKAAHPAAYLAAALETALWDGDAAAEQSLLLEALRRGIELRPPDIQLSRAGFSLEETASGHQAIRWGLSWSRSSAKYTGALMEARLSEPDGRFASMDALRAAAEEREVPPTYLTALVQAGACASLGERADDAWQQRLLGHAFTPPTGAEPVSAPNGAARLTLAGIGPAHVGKAVSLVAMLGDLRMIPTGHGASAGQMAVALARDASGALPLVILPPAYASYSGQLASDTPLIVTARVQLAEASEGRGAGFVLLAEKLQPYATQRQAQDLDLTPRKRPAPSGDRAPASTRRVASDPAQYSADGTRYFQAPRPAGQEPAAPDAQVVITLHPVGSDHEDDERMRLLKQIMLRHPGPTNVMLYFPDDPLVGAPTYMPLKRTVSPDDAFQTEVAGLLGDGCLEVR